MVAAIVVLAVLTILSYFGIGSPKYGVPVQRAGEVGSPVPIPTGIVTATFADGRSAVGRFASARVFVPCASATTQPFTADDAWRAGGQCQIAFADSIARALGSGARGTSLLINSIAFSNDRSIAVATYVSAATTGQALLVRRSGRWFAVAKSEASGFPLDASLEIAGVPGSTVAALQSRLAFDIASPSRHVRSPSPSP